MAFDPTLAAIRFGTGLGPRHAPPRDAQALLASLTGPDEVQNRYPVPGFTDARPSIADFRSANQARRASRGTAREEAAQQAYAAIRRNINDERRRLHLQSMARAVDAPTGLRERLVAFWADHFTVRARGARETHLISPYIEDAIRPHVSGGFAQMLRAVITHPMMLLYLEQAQSVGPNSPVGKRRGRGINENLARELLELHLLGVDGPYGQPDVQQLAELLTGLRFNPDRGFHFDERWAEPGPEAVLGRTYGPAPSLDTIRAALDDLAMHPATAAHLARKMAVHFVSPSPDADLVDTMAARYRDEGGDLLAMVTAMLDHPAAWMPQRAKVRRPQEFINAGLRALGMPGERIVALEPKLHRRHLLGPLRLMGQPWQRPIGPDGWSEEAADWITPQGMAARITWAMRSPRLMLGDLPDPRTFVHDALGPQADADVVFAAGAAEKRSDGIGIVLASAAFNRR